MQVQKDWKPSTVTLTGRTVKDIPAEYEITAPKAHQLPVIGVFIDERIVPGFKYAVRRLSSIDNPDNPDAESWKDDDYLFGNRSMVLDSIGRGFARRFTFQPQHGSLNHNDNYFYSDNSKYGYFFELRVLFAGDEFSIFNVNDVYQGTAIVTHVQEPQVEISCKVHDNYLKKYVLASCVLKMDFIEQRPSSSASSSSDTFAVNGIVCCRKNKGSSSAAFISSIKISIDDELYFLRTGGYSSKCRQIFLDGSDINDVPTRYVITGLAAHECPVIGTYIDQRITPGFHYRVRVLGGRQDCALLFHGQCLRLVGISRGYGKRITFESPSKLHADNYMWSDSSPEGFGFEIKVVFKDDRFRFTTERYDYGVATVFNCNAPQIETHMTKVTGNDGLITIEKQVQVNIGCYIELNIKLLGTNRTASLVNISGVAIVRKLSDRKEANIIRIEDLKVDPQIFFDSIEDDIQVPILIPVERKHPFTLEIC